MLTRYPIDPDKVEKGMVITADEIEKALGVKRTEKDYPLRLLAFGKWLEMQKYNKGEPVRTKIEGDSVRVLVDNEASAYAERRFGQHIKGCLREFQHLSMVNTKALTDPERREHQRRIEKTGKFTQALLGAKEQIKLEKHKRKTPQLKAAEG